METKSEGILLCLYLLATLTFFVNAILLVSVILLQSEKLSISKGSLVSATLVNLLTSASYHPLVISFFFHISYHNERFALDWEILCRILYGLERGLILAITWNIASICLEKYLSLFQRNPPPLQSSSVGHILMPKLSSITSISSWLIGILFGVFSFILTEQNQIKGNNHCYLSVEFYGIYHLIYCAGYISLGFVIPSVVMIVLYSYTTKQLFMHRTLLGRNPFKNSQIISKEQLDKTKCSKQLVFMVLFFLLTVSPYFVMNLILSTGQFASMEFPNTVYVSLVLLLHTNCCICPIICGFSNQRIRLVLVDVVKRRMMYWIRCEGMMGEVRGDTSEEISIISADGSFSERILTVTSRNKVVPHNY